MNLLPPARRIARTALAFALLPPILQAQRPAQAHAEVPTWRSQIAPILYKNCTGCHHSGGSGPFPLTTYEDAKRRADLVQTATESRYMPPWLPAPAPASVSTRRRPPPLRR